MKWLLRMFGVSNRIELRWVSYAEGDRLIRETASSPERDRWVIAKEEDTNPVIGMVYLERREKIQ